MKTDGDDVVFSVTNLKACWKLSTDISPSRRGRVILLNVCWRALIHAWIASSTASSSVISFLHSASIRSFVFCLEIRSCITGSSTLPSSMTACWRWRLLRRRMILLMIPLVTGIRDPHGLCYGARTNANTLLAEADNNNGVAHNCC